MGSCEAWDVIDDVTIATWPTITAWASALLAEWRTETYGIACEFADSVTEEGGPRALEILSILAQATGGDVDELGNVGAGPLEDLISHRGHGQRLLDEIELTARRDSLFARALANVWLNSHVPDVVRHRLARLGARDFVAEQTMTQSELDRYLANRIARGWSKAD